MHRPYSSESQLEAVPSKQRETVASAAQLDLEEVIARHVCLHWFVIGRSHLLFETEAPCLWVPKSQQGQQ